MVDNVQPIEQESSCAFSFGLLAQLLLLFEGVQKFLLAKHGVIAEALVVPDPATDPGVEHLEALVVLLYVSGSVGKIMHWERSSINLRSNDYVFPKVL